MLNDVHFVELPVFDQDRALAFYTDKIGCAVHQDAPYMDGRRWITLRLPGGGATLIHFGRRSGEVESRLPDLTILTNDIESDFAALEARGVVCLEPPMAAPWNPGERYFQCRDSENNIILIQQLPD